MKQLHPGARWIFRLRAYLAMIFLMMFFGWWVFFAIGLLFKSLVLIFVLILIDIALIFLVGEIYARMAYNRWFYEFTEDNLRLERGIIWKRYSNVPYERVQNVDITRGIIARIIGFSTILIQTAGYSAAGRGISVEGYIPAVPIEEGEKIRNFVIGKIKKARGKQGL